MFTIYGTYKGETEELDTADDQKEARFLVGEYQVAFGAGWRIFYKRS